MPTELRSKGINEQEFERLYRVSSPRLYAFIWSILRNNWETQDALQAIFLKIWEKRAEIDLSNNIDSYLFTTAKNLCMNILRDRLYRILMPLDACSTTHDEVNTEIIYNDNARFIQAIIDQLPQKRREVFMLSRVSGMPNKQIAEQLGISENTVETQIRRSLAFLRENLSKEQLIFFAVVVPKPRS